jgi:serine/threonine protein kinase
MQREEFIDKSLCGGKYKILGIKEYFLGDGAFGEVFKGINTKTKEVIAIKRILNKNVKSEKDKIYLDREIRILVSLIRKEQTKSMTSFLLNFTRNLMSLTPNLLFVNSAMEALLINFRKITRKSKLMNA